MGAGVARRSASPVAGSYDQSALPWMSVHQIRWSAAFQRMPSPCSLRQSRTSSAFNASSRAVLLTADPHHHIVSGIPVNGAQSGTGRREPLRPIERPESLTETALKRLRGAIVSGDFQLGQPLSERQLAEMLGISKTPVR